MRVSHGKTFIWENQRGIFIRLDSVVESEPRAEEPKLNWLPEPKLQIAAPAPFYLL